VECPYRESFYGAVMFIVAGEDFHAAFEGGGGDERVRQLQGAGWVMLFDQETGARRNSRVDLYDVGIPMTQGLTKHAQSMTELRMFHNEVYIMMHESQ